MTDNMMPELTLTPDDTAAATAVPPALTLTPDALEMPQQEEKKIEQRLDDLSNRLEESLARTPMGEKKSEETSAKEKPASEEFHFVRILYSTLLKNEVSPD